MINTKRSEDLGSMGESFFKLLAKDAGLVVNASDDDKAGWDFEVEHPNSPTIDYTSQVRQVYRVQVKATRSGKPECSLTYSNLLNLIQFGGPTFIFLALYDSGINPERAYLLHIDEDLALNVLQTLRNKEVANKDLKLNKSKKLIKFDEACSLTELSGYCLSGLFSRSAKPDYLTYIERKVKWLKRIELESGLLHFNITLNDEKSLRSMANCFLGYDEEFTVDTTTYQAPLGIPDTIPLHVDKNHTTTIKPIENELTKAKVKLSQSEFSKKYVFDGLIYTVPKHLPKKFAAMRIKTSLFEIVYRLESNELNFNVENLLDKKLKVPIKELYGFLSFMKEADSEGKTYIEVEPKDGSTPLKVSLSQGSTSVPENFEMEFNAFNATYSKLFELNLIDELIYPYKVFEKIGHFYLLYIVGQEYNPKFSLEFSSESEPAKDVNVVLFNSSVELENTTVIFFSAFYGSVTKLNESTVLGIFSKSELIDELIVPNTEEIEALTKNESERLEETLKVRGFNVL